MRKEERVKPMRTQLSGSGDGSRYLNVDKHHASDEIWGEIEMA